MLWLCVVRLRFDRHNLIVWGSNFSTCCFPSWDILKQQQNDEIYIEENFVFFLILRVETQCV
jgi:hypothetical protein